MENVSFDFTILDEKSGESIFMVSPMFKKTMELYGLFCDDYQVYVETTDDIWNVLQTIKHYQYEHNTELDFQVSKCVDGVITKYDSYNDFRNDVRENELLVK